MNARGAIHTLPAILALSACLGAPALADGSDMVLITGGVFTIGSERGAPNERPRHTVELPPDSISLTEVTNAQYREFWLAVGAARSPHTPIDYPHIGPWPRIAEDAPDAPVVGVTWEDAAACAAWMGGRLPTEAEWEVAARGDDDRMYPWGAALNTGSGAAQPRANVAGKEDGYAYAAPVGSYPGGRSPYGLLDMAGNVAEWVADRYSATYYHHAPRADPTGSGAGYYRVVRGGSWAHDALDARSARRLFEAPDVGLSYVGFRVARDE